MRAAYYNKFETIKLLIESGFINLSDTDICGNSALSMAVLGNAEDSVKILLDTILGIFIDFIE